MLKISLIFLISYLIAAIPSGYWMGKLHGLDITKEGSGGTGATKVLRLVGKWQAFVVLIMDIAKGFVSIYYVKNYLPINDWLFLALTLVPIIAHSKSIFIGFKGGKSSATGAGVLLALNPLVGVITLAIWGGTVFISGISSLGSIVSVPLVPLWLWLFHERLVVILFAVLAAIYIVAFKHRANILRLIKGEEYNFRA